MHKSKTLLLAGASLIASSLFAQSHAATNDILFILDGSGSMWGKISGEAKIATAKKTMTKLIDDVPTEARLGLMTYGNNSKDKCDDVSLLNTIGADQEAIKKSIASLKPLGKTPIQKSLIDGMNVLKNAKPSDAQKSLVLISDGIETCNGDPCAVAETASAHGVNMKVHVVGFDVKDKARKQLECIAEKGGGKYFNAADTAGFKTAMAEVVKVAQATPLPPVEEKAATEATEFFKDEFDGDKLSDTWEVQNENDANYILDGGKLVMLSTTAGGFQAPKPINLITYKGAMPEGDWDVELVYSGDYASAADRLTLGLRDDNKNFLSAEYISDHRWAASCHTTFLSLVRNAKGSLDAIKNTYRTTRNTHCRNKINIYDKSWDAIRQGHQKNPVKMTLSKRGREYTASIIMGGFVDKKGDPIVLTTDKFTLLRAPKTLSFNVDRWKGKKAQGEVLMNIESFTINEVK